MKRKILLSLLLVITTLVVALLAYKPALFFIFEKTHSLFFESDMITQLDEHHFMGLKTNLRHAKLVAIARPHQYHRPLSRVLMSKVKRLHVFHVSTDSSGFRGEGVPEKRSPNSFRIACVGDSVTFGWGVEDDETYETYLEQDIEALLPDMTIEVINAGVPGFRIGNIPDMIRQEIRVYQPNVILAMRFGQLPTQYVEKDFHRDLERIRQASLEVGARLILATPPYSSFDLKAESRLYGEYLETFGRKKKVPTIRFDRVFQAAAPKKGIVLKVGPDRHEVQKYRWSGSLETIFSAPFDGGRESIRPELYQFLDSIDDTEALFFDDGHPDAEGNRLIAKSFAQRMKELGWLEQAKRGHTK